MNGYISGKLSRASRSSAPFWIVKDVLKRVGGFVDPLRDGGDGQRFFEVEVAGGPTIEHLGQPSRTLSALLFRSL